MPQRTGDGGNIRPAVYQQGSVQVPECMDPIEFLICSLTEPSEPSIDRALGHRSSVPGCKEKVVFFPPVPDTEPLFGLNCSVSSQDSEDF